MNKEVSKDNKKDISDDTIERIITRRYVSDIIVERSVT